MLVNLADEPVLGVQTSLDDSVVLLVRNCMSIGSNTVKLCAVQDKELEEL